MGGEMIGKNVGLTIGVIGMALISVLGSAWGTYDTLNILSKDIPRSFLITLTLEGAIVIFAVWCLLANDRWTFALTMLLFLFYVAVAIGFQIVNANLHDAEGRVVAVGSEGVRWAIRNLAFVPPTVTGAVIVLLHIFDQRWGENKRPLMGNRVNRQPMQQFAEDTEYIPPQGQKLPFEQRQGKRKGK